MSQYDFGTIDPDGEDGTELAALLGLWRDALISNHRGTDRPDYVVAGMTWVKTVSGTVEQLLLYDGSNDLVLATYNPTAHTVLIPDANLSANLQALAGLAGAANKGFYFNGAGALSLFTLTALGRSLLAAADAPTANALLPKAQVRANKNSTAQTGIATGVDTKMTLTNEVKDTDSFYDAANSKIIPTRACTLRIFCKAFWSAGIASGTGYWVSIFKNGSVLFFGNEERSSSTGGLGCFVLADVDFNGTTDYVEIFVTGAGSSQTISGQINETYLFALEIG